MLMKIRAIYTFGSPRILSPEAALHAESSLFPEKIFRHVASRDVIPEIPSKHHPDGTGPELFDHAGLISFFDSHGEIRFSPGPWSRSRPRLARALAELPKRGAQALKAHRAPGYNSLVYEHYRRNQLARPNGWDPAVALACARAARLAYKGPVHQVLPLLGFASARLVAGARSEALVVLPKEIEALPFGIVAFRGGGPELFDLEGVTLWRSLIAEWQRKAAAEREPWYPEAPGLAHGAWLHEVEEIELTLLDTLQRFCPDLPIVVTGHSKGGAQALLWAMRHAQEARERRLNLAERLSGPRPGDREEDWPFPSCPELPWEPASGPGGDWRRPLSHAEVGRRLRLLRESGGVTQAQLAARIGCEQDQISRMETGKVKVQLDALLHILADFDVSVADFFDDGPRESVTPGDLRMLEEYLELSEEDREAVSNLLRFKLDPE